MTIIFVLIVYLPSLINPAEIVKDPAVLSDNPVEIKGNPAAFTNNPA
ncbi:hypothetical protein LCL96_05175 [Rossellomorea aquimaris]|nr:hypothetical protein [Rossellomorea aquimaris]MCA1058313.1 hypothetical protein [Rossellomorea aquimaris]